MLADGPCTEQGELALGRNVLVAFMPWRGYNFEDAILISEKLVREDYYTSIHIEEFEIEARDTKLGPEEITRDIPNVSESALKDLDESGIVRIGATVKAGDILVGKVTPKGETQLTPEEKLLRAIFGEKAGDVRDASLKVPPGIEGTDRRRQDLLAQGRREGRAGQGDRAGRDRAAREEHQGRDPDPHRGAQQEDPRPARRQEGHCGGQGADRPGARSRQGDEIDRGDARAPDPPGDPAPAGGRAAAIDAVEIVYKKTDSHIEVLHRVNEERIELLQKGDELPPGVIKLVKVYVAMKRKLQVGDKMAGRHGNKGVISRILPEEDMPYLPDGTPVEIVLNPLGVPSRMNVGQILETHLGWAGKVLGLKFATPVFDGAREADIKELLRQAEPAGVGQDAALRRHDRRGRSSRR